MKLTGLETDILHIANSGIIKRDSKNRPFILVSSETRRNGQLLITAQLNKLKKAGMIDRDNNITALGLKEIRRLKLNVV